MNSSSSTAYKDALNNVHRMILSLTTTRGHHRVTGTDTSKQIRLIDALAVELVDVLFDHLDQRDSNRHITNRIAGTHGQRLQAYAVIARTCTMSYQRSPSDESLAFNIQLEPTYASLFSLYNINICFSESELQALISKPLKSSKWSNLPDELTPNTPISSADKDLRFDGRVLSSANGQRIDLTDLRDRVSVAERKCDLLNEEIVKQVDINEAMSKVIEDQSKQIEVLSKMVTASVGQLGTAVAEIKRLEKAVEELRLLLVNRAVQDSGVQQEVQWHAHAQPLLPVNPHTPLKGTLQNPAAQFEKTVYRPTIAGLAQVEQEQQMRRAEYERLAGLGPNAVVKL